LQKYENNQFCHSEQSEESHTINGLQTIHSVQGNTSRTFARASIDNNKYPNSAL
jgi:hypothetical protein